ncbi:Putative glycosyltransferase EpsF [Corynebacterium glaucum]|uniref:Putative glycosyltransferase EpsF n=1 Tax=Corynebacterium glaucum TaxID=187491 RepID=A0A1Q2HW51_9CORY|nr:glycosyltransferase [Corynebacterium glaucum]AQQ15081.1 Putative glycosyltransferase EpsF [Corynebacterium glaucum]WJZ07580.1 Putative glycosyltransferase EpsF [Corynebacterium glaucum]
MAKENTDSVIRVLHITEAFGGGARTAIQGYAALDMSVEHNLLWNERRQINAATGPDEGLFVYTAALPESHVAALKTVVATIRELEPDVVHAHSSFAGVYGRLAAALTRTPVVYTPHGLSTERKDISKWKRKVFHTAERALSPLTTVFAGCSTHEGSLLRELNPRVPNQVVPNALPDAKVAELPRWADTERASTPTLCFVGRITSPRYPEMACEIAEALEPEGIRCIWAGDGEPELREMVESSGIEVLGWLDREALFDRVASSHVAVHTSRWDGFPMSVLEFRAIGIPTVVSDIPALAECPDEARFDSATSAVKAIHTALENPGSVDWSTVEQTYTEEQQRDSLLSAYESARRRRKR